MALIQFTRNYDDLSTDRGYQFKFYCDKCENGYMSEFQASAIGIAGTVLRTAGGLLGGFLGRLGDNAYDIQRAVGGKAHDEAFKKAVEEAKVHFKQCSRCGKWVCPENCWNHKKGLCEECAPDIEEELAVIQNNTKIEQLRVKAQSVDFTKDIDIANETPLECPECGARTGNGKFCPECGAVVVPKVTCSRCGTECDKSTKFCPECGETIASVSAVKKCTSCGEPIEPGKKFCTNCGTKI